VIVAISEEDWTPIPYWIDERAARGRDDLPALLPKHPEVRLIVRTGEAHPGQPAALFSTYDYHAFITDREGETTYLEADHRRTPSSRT